jgi:hypothetical protein
MRRDQQLTDPANIIDTLDPDAIATRLETIMDEAAVLRRLLRAARERERRRHLQREKAKAEVER